MSEQRELRVQYTGDASQLVREQARAEAGHASLQSRLEASGRSFQRIGSQFTAAGRALTVGLTVPIVGLGIAAVKSAVDFESAFAGVRKTVDASEAEFKELEAGIRNMAKEIPATTTELSKIAEAAGALGIRKEDILGFTRVVADMAETTDLTADAAATAFGKLGNVLGLTGDEFSRLGSTIVDLGNKGASTESEIVELTLRLAGSAKVAGFAADEIIGLAAALADAGINAEAGGTAMSRVIQKIGLATVEGGKELKNFAAIADQSAAGFVKSWEKDPAAALNDFLKGLRRAADEGKNLDLVLKGVGITEARQIDTLKRLALAQNDLGRALDIAKNAWRENTALTAEAEKRYATVAAQWQVFKNTVQDALITLGQALLPVLQNLLNAAKPIVDFIGRLFEAFGRLPQGIQLAIVAFAGFLAVLGPILIGVGALVSAIGALLPILVPLGVGLAVFAGLAAAGVAIAMNWDRVRGVFAAVWAGMQSFFAWLGTTLGPLIATVRTEFASVVNAVRQSWPQIVAIIRPVLDGIRAAWSVFSTYVLTNAKTVFSLLVSTITNAIKIVANVIKAVLAVIRGDWSAAWTAVKNIGSAIWGQIRALITAATSTIRNIISTWLSAIRGLVTAGWNAVRSIITAAANAIKSVVTSMVNAIKSVWSAAMNAIVSAAQGAWNRVVGIFESAWARISSIVSKIGAAMSKLAFWRESPSKLEIDAAITTANIAHTFARLRTQLDREFSRFPIPGMGVRPTSIGGGRVAGGDGVMVGPRRGSDYADGRLVAEIRTLRSELAAARREPCVLIVDGERIQAVIERRGAYDRRSRK